MTVARACLLRHPWARKNFRTAAQLTDRTGTERALASLRAAAEIAFSSDRRMMTSIGWHRSKARAIASAAVDAPRFGSARHRRTPQSISFEALSRYTNANCPARISSAKMRRPDITPWWFAEVPIAVFAHPCARYFRPRPGLPDPLETS